MHHFHAGPDWNEAKAYSNKSVHFKKEFSLLPPGCIHPIPVKGGGTDPTVSAISASA
jgi:hypothetical protein